MSATGRHSVLNWMVSPQHSCPPERQWLISKWGLCKQNQLKWGHIWIRVDSTFTDWYLYERETHGEAMWWMRQRREGMCLQTETLGHCQHPPEAGRETGGRFTSTFLRTQPWGKPESVGVRIYISLTRRAARGLQSSPDFCLPEPLLLAFHPWISWDRGGVSP